MPLGRPDGLRTAGPRTLIQAERAGTCHRADDHGNRAEVRVVQDSLPGATGVTLVGDSALVLVGRLKAVAVPYRPPQASAPAQPTVRTEEHFQGQAFAG